MADDIARLHDLAVTFDELAFDMERRLFVPNVLSNVSGQRVVLVKGGP